MKHVEWLQFRQRRSHQPKSELDSLSYILPHSASPFASPPQSMKPPINNGSRKKLSFFSFASARSTSNTDSNPNLTPGFRPQNTEQAPPVSASTVLRGSETDDEWYIPYKGPYQLPSSPSSPGHFQGHHHRANSTSSSNVLPGRSKGPALASSSLRRSRSRDSWGDPIYPTHDLPAEGSGYGYDDYAVSGVELQRSSRNQASRDGDRNSERGNKEDEENRDKERNRSGRSGSLTVTISKSRFPGLNPVLGDDGIMNESTGGNTVIFDQGEAKGKGKHDEKELEDKDPNGRHRHLHRPVLISQPPTLLEGPIGSVTSLPSPPLGTAHDATPINHAHRRRASTAPSSSSPTRFRFSTRAVPVESIPGSLSLSPSPSPTAPAPVPAVVSHTPAPPSPKRSRSSRTETSTRLLSLPGLGFGLGGSDAKGNRRRSTVSSGTGTGSIFARSPSPTASGSGFASSSSPPSLQLHLSGQPTHNVNRTITPSYISLDPGALGGVGESPMPVAFGGTSSGLGADGVGTGSRSRSGKGLGLAGLLAPTHRLLKKLSKLGLGMSSKEEEREREKQKEKEKKEKERTRENEKGADIGLRPQEPQPRARSQSTRPVLRIYPPDHGDGVGDDENSVLRDRYHRQGQRTETIVSGEHQPHAKKNRGVAESNHPPVGGPNTNTRMHSRNRSKSSPLPRSPTGAQPSYHANNTNTQIYTHPGSDTHAPHAHHSHYGHSPEPELESARRSGLHSHPPSSHSHHSQSHHAHPHLHLNLNLNPTRSYSHSVSTYASTSTVIATAPSVGTNSKPSPSSAGAGGGGGTPAVNKPSPGLEIEEMDREDKDAYNDEEEEEEENYRYGRGRGGGGGSAAYGLQPSSATSSIDGGHLESGGRKSKKEKHPYAYNQQMVEDVTALRQHPYARAFSPVVFSQRGSVMSADDNGFVGLGLGIGAGTGTGVGVGTGMGTGVGTMRRPGLTTRQDQVGRLSPIPSGLSLPSVSVPSVGAVGAGASAASGASLVGGAVVGGGGDASWDRGTPTAMFRNSMSTPDLRFTGGVGADEEWQQRVDDGGSAKMKMRVWPRLGGTPSLKEREKEKGRREKEKEKERRWLSTQSPISILLPRPRFRVRTLEKGEAPAVAGQGLGTVGMSGKHSLQPRSRSLMDLVGGGGGGEEKAAKVGRPPPELPVKRDPGMVDAATSNENRPSYARDDLSLLSLDKVLEERSRLDKDRKMWQAQAARSLGNKQSREMSRTRAKSLGRMMNSSQVKGNVARSYRQQSNIDYLAARACLGNQEFSPLMEYSEGGAWVSQQLNEKSVKHERHERKPSASGSSGVGTTSVGHRSAAPHGKHQRNDSWSRSAIRLARSLPQMCGIMVGSDEKLKSGESLEEALKREDTKVIKLADPAVAASGKDQRVDGASPVSSAASDGAVGIAISTPPVPEFQEPSYVLPDHPYAFSAGRQHDAVGADMTSQADDLLIQLPAHPYAQGGLSMSSGNPEYAGRHPTSSSTHLMTSLGLSEVSARHRLPPQLTIGQNRGMEDQQSQQRDRSHSYPLHVKVDSRNSYQGLRPYVRVDSNVAPPEKLWVTYSPGVVREVLHSEVFQYSPRELEQRNLPASLAAFSKEGASRRDPSDDVFLKKYKRMSTVYQNTAAMADAMYDAFDQRASTVPEPRYSARVDDGEMEVEDAIHVQEDSMEPESQPEQDFSQDLTSQERYDYRPRRSRTPEPVRVPGSSSSSKGLADTSPIEYNPSGASSANRFANTSKEASTYSSPVTPSAPRISSPNNLEPFHDLFYKPPCDSETDSLSSPPNDETPSFENVPWDVGSSSSQRTGLSSLVRRLGDELEQMTINRQRSSSQYSQDSGMPEIPPRTSSLARPGMQSGHINSDVGPLHFLFQNSPQQESRRAHPSRFSPFDPANTIPEDVELSENPSSDEKPEDDTMRYPIVTIDPASTPMSSQLNHPPQRQSLFGSETNVSEEHLPAEPLGSSRGLSLDVLRSSHLTSSTISCMSALSEFPTPPETIMHEQMTISSSYLDDDTIP